MEVLNDINPVQLTGKRVYFFREIVKKIRNPRTGQIEGHQVDSAWVFGRIQRIVGNASFNITLHILADDKILTFVRYTFETIKKGFEILPDV